MKKQYIEPNLFATEIALQRIMQGSTLDPNEDDQSVTPSDEEYDDEFSAHERYEWGDLWNPVEGAQ